LSSFEPSALVLWKFRVEAQQFIRPIWPVSGYSIQWPPVPITNKVAEYLCSAFVTHIMDVVGITAADI